MGYHYHSHFEAVLSYILVSLCDARVNIVYTSVYIYIYIHLHIHTCRMYVLYIFWKSFCQYVVTRYILTWFWPQINVQFLSIFCITTFLRWKTPRFWTYVMIACVLYFFAIIATSLIGKADAFKDDADAQECFPLAGNRFKCLSIVPAPFLSWWNLGKSAGIWKVSPGIDSSKKTGSRIQVDTVDTVFRIISIFHHFPTQPLLACWLSVASSKSSSFQWMVWSTTIASDKFMKISIPRLHHLLDLWTQDMATTTIFSMFDIMLTLATNRQTLGMRLRFARQVLPFWFQHL